MGRRKPMTVNEQRLALVHGCKNFMRVHKEHCEDNHIFAIDPARGSTGWCRRKGSKRTGGVIRPDTVGFSKVVEVGRRVKKKIGKTRPLCVIEGYAMAAKFGREKAGELGGVLRGILYYKKLPLLIVAPTTLKSWVQAKTKSGVMLEVLSRYGVKISQDDAADAFVMQEIGHKALLMAKAVVSSGIVEPNDVRLWLKDQKYKEEQKGLGKLFRYQENSLVRMLSTQGITVEFFSKELTKDIEYDD